ncbi:MAG TPA: adenylate/guanylate cyclase domain-containing protein, partial [Gaiellaceae bacterium]|nr:adenylate/guanylate cyclase domain-containing protein [Gaiellaceae bacterium]
MTARAAISLLALAVPVAVLGLLLAVPELDATWENHPAHFWLVLAAALVNVVLGVAIGEAARRRRDARLLLLALAFVAAAGFLGLHALATPGVLLSGPNAGFTVATPVGLLLAGAFAALSGVEWGVATSVALVRRSRLLLGALLAAMGAWAVLSLLERGPLAGAPPRETTAGMAALAAGGVLLFLVAGIRYLRLYRRRRERLVFAVAVGFALLAEALVVVVAALPTSWQLSWWEWHVLMLLGFAFVAYAARREWHEERFSAVYLDETLAGAKDVSVLFADLEGFTPYAERHAPAEVTRMLNAYFERIVPAIAERHGGEVHQLIGDAVMAVFNKDGGQADHAVRAVRAALDLQRIATEAAEAGWPRFRVGVNSGRVSTGVVGAGAGHRKHGVVGDTVNLAARLEREARAG